MALLVGHRLRVVPGARVELLPGVGHSPMLEDPRTTGKVLLDFAAPAAHPADSAPGYRRPRSRPTGQWSRLR